MQVLSKTQTIVDISAVLKLRNGIGLLTNLSRPGDEYTALLPSDNKLLVRVNDVDIQLKSLSI